METATAPHKKFLVVLVSQLSRLVSIFNTISFMTTKPYTSLKVFLILTGVVFFVIILIIISYFNRIGKPVNSKLSDSYYHHRWRNKIIFSPMGNWFELGYSELEADPATFIVLSREFGKDNRSIYWKDVSLEVDYASFRLDAQHIPKDKFAVYLESDVYPPSFMEGADPESYERLVIPTGITFQRWGKDKNAIFLNGEKVNVDRNSFQLLSNTFAVDKENIYQIVMNQHSLAGTKGSAELLLRGKNDGTGVQLITDYYLQMGASIFAIKSYNEVVALKFNRIDTLQVIDQITIKVNSTVVKNGVAQ